MVFTKCSKCGKKIRIEENDTMPGCREHEDVDCPNCGEHLTSVFTSGIPRAYIDK